MYTWPWLINNLGTLLLCPIGIIANLLCLLTLATVKKKPPRPSILVNSRQLPLKFMKRLRKKEKLNKYSAKNDGECLEVFRQSGESIQLQCTGKLNNNNKRSNNNQHLDIPNKEISHKLSHQSMLDERYREKKKLSNCSKRFSSISFGSINDDSKRSSNNKNMNDRKYKFSMLRSISQSKQESSIVNGKQKMLRASGFVEYMKAVAFFDMLSAICEFSLSLIVVHRYYIANRYMYKSRQLRETYKTSLNDPNITIQKIQFLKNFQNSNFTQTEPIEQTHAIFRSFFQTLSMRYEASVLDDIYCSLSTFFRYWCYNLSCWYVVALTIDRFVCVVLSNLVIRNRSKNKVISCFSRIFSRVVTNYGKIRCARKIIVLVAIFAAMLHSYRLIFFRFMCDEKKIRVITNNIEKLFYSDYIRFDQFPLIYQTIGKLSKLSAQNSYVTTLNPTEQLIQNQLNDLPKYLTVNVTHCTCKCKQPRVEVYIGVYLFRLCLYFVLPCATLLFCNTAIMCKLKLYNKNSTQSISCNYRWYCSRLRNLFKKKNNETSISNSDKKMLNSPEKKQMSSVSDKNRQKKNQITKTLLIVSCIFVVLFTPQPKEMEALSNSGNVSGKVTDVVISNILAKGICETFDNKTYDYEFGPGGHYCLVEGLREHIKPIRLHSVMAKMMIEKKAPRPMSHFARLETFLKDLVDERPITKINDDGYMYNYYPKLELLNIELFLGNVLYNPIDIKPFLPSYYFEVGHFLMDALRHDLKKDKAEPKLIHMAFLDIPNLRIHQITYYLFFHYLQDLLPNGIENAPPPDFPIYVEYQLFTVPSIRKWTTFFPFPCCQITPKFQLKGLSIRLYAEVELSFRNIPSQNNVFNGVGDCVENFYLKMKDYVWGDLAEFLLLYMKKYALRFRGLCTALLDEKEFYPLYDEMGDYMHTFSIIQKNDDWFFMNDQHSFRIDDIDKMTYLLKNERVDAVVLEVTEE
ncbi:hypothetical protein SNEBB_001442 [Seison nebaliae]|nr:hypothetical protein SNEBB_001442 [Seison nebaliae]